MTIIKSRQLKLSASSIKTYQQCPRKWYFTYVTKEKKKDWPHLALGNFVHKVLELFHERVMKEQISSDRWGKLMSEICKTTVASFKLSKEHRASSKDMLSKYLTLIIAKPPDVVSNEQDFTIQLDEDTLLRGFIDRIDSDPVRGYDIIDYKGLALDTPIPTPSGWTTMGELKVGDQVFGSDGNPTDVIVKSAVHNRPCFKISFTDKTEVICDNVHLWPVKLRNSSGNRDSTMSSEELFDDFIKYEKRGRFYIPLPEPLEYNESSLPIDPWVLGAWLGDGHSKTGSLTVGEQDLEEMSVIIKAKWGNYTVAEERERSPFRRKIYTVTLSRPNKTLCGYGHSLDASGKCNTCTKVNNDLKRRTFKKGSKTNVCLRNILSSEHLLYNKHIPKMYLMSSIQQRIELLRGLMDTDGHWNPLRKQCVFVTSKYEFSTQVLELIRSLGIHAASYKVVDKNGFISYPIYFCPTQFNPFLLPRKSVAYDRNAEGFSKTKIFNSKHALISNIEKCDSVPTQCISVKAENSLYVCGRGIQVSHNTGKSKYLDEFQLLVYGLYLKQTYPDMTHFRGTYIALVEGPKIITYTFTQTDLDRCREAIMFVADSIRSDRTWEPKPQFLCSYCDFESICPAVQEAKFEKAGGWVTHSSEKRD